MRRRLDGRSVEPTAAPNGVTFQPFDAAVAPACLDLMNRAFTPAGTSPMAFDQWYLPLVADREYDPELIWVAIADRAVVGVCHCWTGNFVKDLVVEESWRGRGLGSAMLSRALRKFAESGAAYVDLKTDLDNHTAQSFYKRLGFTIVEEVLF